MSKAKAWIWQCQSCARECVPIRAESRCMCGHRLKDHTDGHRCSNRSCSCPRFSFIVAEGSWVLRCRCKHKHTDHCPSSHECKKAACACSGFHSPWVCNCDHPWSEHQQILVEKQVLRLRDLVTQALDASSSSTSAEPCASSSMVAAAAVADDLGKFSAGSGLQAAATAPGGEEPKTTVSTAGNALCSVSLLHQQQQQQACVSCENAPAVTASDAGLSVVTTTRAGVAAVVGAGGTELLAGDLTCEVNRWDLLQRGKEQ